MQIRPGVLHSFHSVHEQWMRRVIQGVTSKLMIGKHWRRRVINASSSGCNDLVFMHRRWRAVSPSVIGRLFFTQSPPRRHVTSCTVICRHAPGEVQTRLALVRCNCLQCLSSLFVACILWSMQPTWASDHNHHVSALPRFCEWQQTSATLHSRMASVPEVHTYTYKLICSARRSEST